jgi:hypothetical protein
MMRRLCCCALIFVSVGLTALGTLRIDLFDAEVELGADGTLSVMERITVTFSTPHHGIEREIPVSYRVPSTGASTTIGFRLGEVLLDGDAVPLLARRRGRYQYLRIGDADRTITGTHTYSIAYDVDRVILFHEDYLQLYWNVTGNEWRIPIIRATASVRLPASVDPESVSTSSYAGYIGSSARGAAASIDSTGRWTFEAGPFNPGEGLTIDLAVPREVLPISPPSLGERLLWFLDANKAAALPILVLVGMLVLWFRIGRDPRKRVIAPAFAPPRGMHPGEVGVLIDDRIDLRDVSAMVVGLAVKGYLRIEEVREDDPAVVDESRGSRGRSTPLDYRFVRRRHPATELSEVEETILDAIFEDEGDERTLSSLESNFYKHLPTVKSRLYGGLIDAGYYANNPERVRAFYRSLGLMAIVAGMGIAVAFRSLYLGTAVAMSGLIVLAFSPIMPRKTRTGVRALEEVLGLARYIRLAEVDRIEFHDAPEKNPQLFERLLPYAMALNLTRIWTAQFEGLLNAPPEWYGSTSPVFRGHLFALSMWHLSAGMNRTFASAPRTASGGRSAWGGGSSFGGGFSGGGFGGGGGGGW